MIRFVLGNALHEFSFKKHGKHYLEQARRFSNVHKDATIHMTPTEIVAALEALDAAQVAASQATSTAVAAAIAAVQALPTGAVETPTDVKVDEPDGSEETFTPEAATA